MVDPAGEPDRAAPRPPLETAVRRPKPVVQDDNRVGDDRRRLGMLPSERLFDQIAPEVRRMEVLSVQQPSSSIRRRRAAAYEHSEGRTRPVAAYFKCWLRDPTIRVSAREARRTRRGDARGCAIILRIVPVSVALETLTAEGFSSWTARPRGLADRRTDRRCPGTWWRSWGSENGLTPRFPCVFLDGSPRASIRPTSKTPRRCSARWHESAHG
jgi:hypothetical protein